MIDQILRMSYIYMPNYLKPCFLYIGVFEEDRSIRVSVLKKLWISEGFLKPTVGKCLETIAQEYLMELVDRNLILVDELGSIGNVKYCKIHDLLRDFCLKEVEKERFYHVIRDDPPANNSSERRIVFPRKSAKLLANEEVLRSLSYTRSIIRDYDDDEEGYLSIIRDYNDEKKGDGEVELPNNLRLLRIFKACDYSMHPFWNAGYFFLDNVFELVNSRYLCVRVHNESNFPVWIDLLWNLHILIIHCSNDLIAPIEIWQLHQLRHLVFEGGQVILPNPPGHENDIVIMENLHTLKGVSNLYLNEEVVKRIPNVKKLHLSYVPIVKQMETEGVNCLSYLRCLSKLENLCCSTKYAVGDYWPSIMFPRSLKKLFVEASHNLKLDDMMPKIGSLPLLEKFVLLQGGYFKTGRWETIEGQFPNLKFLQLNYCSDLEDWIVSDSSHFPLLQKLYLRNLVRLKEIPSEVGDIATLKSIELHCCSFSAAVSAKKIVEEQEDLYGDQLDLHVRIEVRKVEEAMKSLASANFEIKVIDY